MVTELLRRENSYRQAFLELQQRREGEGVGWLERLRAGAMERFEESGFPSVKDEEWKYTNVAAIAAVDFQAASSQTSLAGEVDVQGLALFRHLETQNSQLVFINGVLRTDLSGLTAIPEGVIALDLATAIADERYREIVWKHLGQQADYVVNGFTALNTALISHGAFVYIPKDAILSVPLNLLFISDGADTASFPRVLVVAEDNSKATLIESYASTKDSRYFTNAVVEIVLKDGARLEHYKLQRESAKAFTLLPRRLTSAGIRVTMRPR